MAEATVVLITGANTGIGFEAVKALLQSERRYRIFLGGRDMVKAERAATDVAAEVTGSVSAVEPIQIDVQSDESIANAVATVAAKVKHLDVLVNNAGASFDAEIERSGMPVREAFARTFDVNVAGANAVTEAFLPLLLCSADPRVLFTTSGRSSLADCADTSAPHYRVPPAGLPKPRSATAYRVSKAALNMLMLEWTRMLKADGVKVWCIAPGLLSTGLGGDPEALKKMGAKHPSFGGEGIRGVVEGKRDAHVGRVVREYSTPIQDW